MYIKTKKRGEIPTTPCVIPADMSFNTVSFFFFLSSQEWGCSISWRKTALVWAAAESLSALIKCRLKHKHLTQAWFTVDRDTGHTGVSHDASLRPLRETQEEHKKQS